MGKKIATMVEIPIATLNTLKGLLFEDTKGVNLSPIINDLGGDDVTAINVALVFKNKKPVIDGLELPRFQYRKYEFVRYSLIQNIVYAKSEDYSSLSKFSLDEWLNMSVYRETESSESK